MSTPASPHVAPADIRVIAGNPTAHELAALVTVLVGGATRPPSPEPGPGAARPSRWADPVRRLGGLGGTGRDHGGWRGPALPH